MRVHGRLARWNDERGFGFIEAGGGSEEVFVHISAFPRNSIRPTIGEIISFEVDMRGDGKKQAIRIMRPGSATRTGGTQRADQPKPARSRRNRSAPGARLMTAGVLALMAIGIYGYISRSADRSTSTAVETTQDEQVEAHQAWRSPPATTQAVSTPALPAIPRAILAPAAAPGSRQPFQCNGRTLCSQMTSCEDATWVLQHCPATRMDGNHDGVPCERQWCRG